jgi:K+-transporting ATPase ATPase C chain
MSTTYQPLDHVTTGWRQPLRCALVLILLCGGVYPLLTTLLAGLLFPYQASGSLIGRDGHNIGSELVGQVFADPRYFYGRPSAAGYDPFAVAGSNQAPGNPDLRARATATARTIAEREQVGLSAIPVDLIAASGSGIDPHISPAAAALQIARIARVRGLSEDQLRQLVAKATEPPVWGVLGQPRVNVLRLNLALDELDRP